MEWFVLGMLVLSVLWRGGKGMEVTWLLAGLAGAVTMLEWWRQRRASTMRSVPWVVWRLSLAFLVWTVVSFLHSATQNYGLDEVLRDVSLMLLFFWMIRTARDDHRNRLFVERLAIVLSIVTLLACAIGIAVYVLQPVNRFVGTFFDYRFQTDYWPNAWAEYLLLAWPIVLWTLQRHRVLQILCLGIVFGCLFLSYSRGAFLCLLAQLGIIAVIGAVIVRSCRPMGANRFSLTTIKEFAIAAVCILALSIAVFVGVNLVRARFHDVQSVTEKMTFTASEGRSSIDERRDFWRQAFTLSLERPVFGGGPYSFRFLQPRLQRGIFATSDHPHNVILKLATERGWPAALLFVVLLMVVIVSALKAIADWGRESREIDRLFLLLSLAAVVGVFLHNQLDYNLQFVGIALPWWLLLGALAASFSGRERGESSVSFSITRPVEIVMSVLLLLVTIIEGRTLILSSLGRHAEARGDIRQALGFYDSAAGEIFSRDMHLSEAQLKSISGDFRGAQRALDLYTNQNREDARAWIMAGDLIREEPYPKHSDLQQAVAYYERALVLGKYNYLGATYGLVESLERLGDRHALQRRKPEFDAIIRMYAQAIVENTHFIALSSNVEAFSRLMMLLGRVYPRDAEGYRGLESSVTRHAALERQRITSRAPGYLW
ncbi:O-antigen ligase family protein [Candidatus Peregrinibacteria bacterium]|nr:O-antigen ligase family protein [Candidatus Peregrinibacteria bacterium]